jgi:hypothetical protein
MCWLGFIRGEGRKKDKEKGKKDCRKTKQKYSINNGNESGQADRGVFLERSKVHIQ